MDTARWLRYFQENRRRPDPGIPERIADVPPAVVGPLVRSLQRFYLGEAGEGRVAREAAASRDPALDDAAREAIALYVREEGRHAREIARLLAALGAGTIRGHVTAALFERTRRLLGLRTKMLTIAVAEVVGVVFYGLVRDRSGSAAVSRVAAAIARDEVAHLDFQAAFFGRALAVAPPWARVPYAALLAAGFAAILAGAIATVAIDQRAFLSAVGVRPWAFVALCARSALPRLRGVAGSVQGGEIPSSLPLVRRVLLALSLVVAGCTCSGAGSPPSPGQASAPSPSATAPAPARGAPAGCPGAPDPAEVAPGLVVERLPVDLDPAVPLGDRCLTVVRVDPARYRFRLLTALPGGAARTAPAWAAQAQLTGVVNASMYHADLRSTGLLIRDGVVHTGDDNPRFGGFMAFDPVDPGSPPVAFAGRTCPGFDLAALRKQYRSIVQNYRLLDCDGRAIPWRDEKTYSAAAIGMDRDGRVVFLHARTPTSMTRFAEVIAAPGAGVRAALYVEGGPEASVYVSSGAFTLEQVGSYETGFNENDDNRHFWDLPNVLGFSPR